MPTQGLLFPNFVEISGNAPILKLKYTLKGCGRRSVGLSAEHPANHSVAACVTVKTQFTRELNTELVLLSSHSMVHYPQKDKDTRTANFELPFTHARLQCPHMAQRTAAMRPQTNKI